MLIEHATDGIYAPMGLCLLGIAWRSPQGNGIGIIYGVGMGSTGRVFLDSGIMITRGWIGHPLITSEGRC